MINDNGSGRRMKNHYRRNNTQITTRTMLYYLSLGKQGAGACTEITEHLLGKFDVGRFSLERQEIKKCVIKLSIGNKEVKPWGKKGNIRGIRSTLKKDAAVKGKKKMRRPGEL